MALDATAVTEIGATFPANVYPPKTGTAIEAADVNAGETALAERTMFLYLGGRATDTGVERVVRDPWIVESTSPYPQFTPVIVAASPSASWADMSPGFPHGCTVKQLAVQFVTQVHASMPVTKPKLSLLKLHSTTGAITTIASQTDPETDPVAYSSPHEILLSLGAGVVIDRATYMYVVKFEGESGTNRLDIDSLLPLRAYMDISAVDAATV